MTRRRTAADPAAADAAAWDRSRLLLLVVAVAAAAAVLLSGFGYGIYLVTTGPSTSGDAGVGRSTAAPPAAGRDAIAAAPMLTVAADARQPAPPAAMPGPLIRVPAATRVGPAGVPTGFPQTPAGAVGQLAAIEVAVLQGMSIDYADRGLPGVGVAGRARSGRVAADRQRAGVPGRGGDDQWLGCSATVQVRPAAGQVKGVDGPDWVVACVLSISGPHRRRGPDGLRLLRTDAVVAG